MHHFHTYSLPYNRIILLVGSVFLGAGFLFSQVWLLSFVGFLGLLCFIYTSDEIPRWKIFLWGWLAGFIFIGLVIIWFWHLLPLDWLGISNPVVEITLAFFYWGTTTLALALFVGLWVVAASFLKRGNFWDLLIVPLLWVLFEYLRMWGFALLTYQSDVFFGPHFSVGFVGYLLANNTNLLQFARWGGVYTLSLVFVFIAVFLYKTILCLELALAQRSLRINQAPFFYGALLAFFIFYSVLPFHILFGEGDKTINTTLNVALVTTNFEPTLEDSSDLFEEKYTVYKALLQEVASKEKKPDIVVFPEHTGILRIAQKRGELNELTQPFKEKRTLIIDSDPARGLGFGTYARLYYYDTLDGFIGSQDKRYLVPQGEYTPALYEFFLKYIAGIENFANIQSHRAYVSGKKPAETVVVNDINIATLFCSEILSPSLYRQLTNEQGADIFINVSSQSWFNQSHILHHQLLSIMRVHAVANGSYLLQATNGAPSLVIDSRGNVVAQTKWGTSGILVFDVPAVAE